MVIVSPSRMPPTGPNRPRVSIVCSSAIPDKASGMVAATRAVISANADVVLPSVALAIKAIVTPIARSLFDLSGCDET